MSLGLFVILRSLPAAKFLGGRDAADCRKLMTVGNKAKEIA